MGVTKIKAVLFDLDGTLVNTLEDIANAMNGALRQAGLPEWPTEAYKQMVGNGAKMLAHRAVRGREEWFAPVFADYMRRYEAGSRILSAPYPGIPELLEQLHRLGLPCAVFSNKPDPDTQNVISFYFPDFPFSVVRGQREDIPVKPDPAGALRIAGELQAAPEEIAYLGDTAVDMECAGRAGMLPVGVLWGFRSAEELRGSGARVLLSSPTDLLSLL